MVDTALSLVSLALLGVCVLIIIPFVFWLAHMME